MLPGGLPVICHVEEDYFIYNRAAIAARVVADNDRPDSYRRQGGISVVDTQRHDGGCGGDSSTWKQDDSRRHDGDPGCHTG